VRVCVCVVRGVHVCVCVQVLALSVATDYTFKESAAYKEYLNDPQVCACVSVCA